MTAPIEPATPVPAAPQNPAPVQQAQPPVGQGDNTFTAQQVRAAIERAREEEKSKLYTRLEEQGTLTQTLKSELDALKTSEQKRADAEAERQAQLDAAQQREEEARLSAQELVEKARREATELTSRLQQQMDAREAMFRKEQERYEISLYIEKRRGEESDNIEPNLLDLINGKSKDEVEASIATLREKSARIMENARQAGIKQHAEMQGVSVASGGPGPQEQFDMNAIPTPEEIAAMDPQDPRYQALRAQLLPGTANQRQNSWFA